MSFSSSTCSPPSAAASSPTSLPPASPSPSSSSQQHVGIIYSPSSSSIGKHLVESAAPTISNQHHFEEQQQQHNYHHLDWNATTSIDSQQQNAPTTTDAAIPLYSNNNNNNGGGNSSNWHGIESTFTTNGTSTTTATAAASSTTDAWLLDSVWGPPMNDFADTPPLSSHQFRAPLDQIEADDYAPVLMPPHYQMDLLTAGTMPSHIYGQQEMPPLAAHHHQYHHSHDGYFVANPSSDWSKLDGGMFPPDQFSPPLKRPTPTIGTREECQPVRIHTKPCRNPSAVAVGQWQPQQQNAEYFSQQPAHYYNDHHQHQHQPISIHTTPPPPIADFGTISHSPTKAMQRQRQGRGQSLLLSFANDQFNGIDQATATAAVDDCHPQQNAACRLIVLKQPEEQHRARYASEGSRGAIKDRAGTSYCTIQLVGHYRPTRVELFAGERRQRGANQPAEFVPHSAYRLIPVAGKSSSMTPCKRVIAEEDGSERLEIVLRPENRMIGILDCIGIMKVCSYGAATAAGASTSNSRAAKKQQQQQQEVKRRKRNATTAAASCMDREQEMAADDGATTADGNNNNMVYIVARAYVPLEAEETEANGEKEMEATAQQQQQKFQLIQAVCEPIRCVQQLGTPDVLKMSLESSTSAGGTELFIIGRNFDPKNTRVLFREYKNDGTLGWNAEAAIDRRFLHQCHIVCTVPAYRMVCRGAAVSLTVICGTKQSHPKNFVYIASEREDDVWGPPDCFSSASGTSNSTPASGMPMSRRSGESHSGRRVPHHQQQQPHHQLQLQQHYVVHQQEKQQQQQQIMRMQRQQPQFHAL